MADVKISNLPELAEAPASGDLVAIVDVSDTTEATSGTTKRITRGNLLSDIDKVVKPASASAPASLDLHEDTDNGTNKITITAPSAIASDKTLTLPDETGTLATQEYAALSRAYPIGSVYINAVNPENPATLLGFGTWSAFATGRTLVGIDAGQTEFDTAEETGGAKTHTLVAGETPPLYGNFTVHDASNGSNIYTASGVFSASSGEANKYKSGGTSLTGAYSKSTIAFNNGGGGGAHNNLQPYVVVYMWKRTA